MALPVIEMAAMAMATVLVVLAVCVQASRPYPEDFTSTDQRVVFRRPWPTHNAQTNLDENQPQFETTRFTRPRTTEYNLDTINGRSEEFETMARASAYKEAQQLKSDREMQKYNNDARNEYPKVLSDGTEILWMTGSQKTTPEEMAQLEGKSKSAGDDVDPVFDHVDSSEWEDGLWGTKHRPGSEHSLQNVEVTQADGTTVSQSFNHP